MNLFSWLNTFFVLDYAESSSDSDFVWGNESDEENVVVTSPEDRFPISGDDGTIKSFKYKPAVLKSSWFPFLSRQEMILYLWVVHPGSLYGPKGDELLEMLREFAREGIQSFTNVKQMRSFLDG